MMDPADTTASAVSQARLMSVLDTAVDGIVVTDDKARVLLYNRACEALFGYSAEEIIGENIRKIMPPHYARAHDSYVGNYIATSNPKIIGIGREVQGQHKDGTVFPIELSVGEAKTQEGRQFIGIMRDLRGRKAVESRLAQLQAQLVSMARMNAIDEMGAAIAHELNQPLTALLLYLQAVTRKLGSMAEAMPDIAQPLDIVGRAAREAERAGSIIQRMRQLVEKREPERQPVAINSLVEDALELTLLGAVPHQVRIERLLEPDLPTIHADPIQIQQILVNLLRNGLEASRGSDERWLRVSTDRDARTIVVTIEDSGAGISEEVVRDLFKAFSSTKRSGLGLGLAISKSLAQNHGGDLTVEPSQPGVGARFVLRLPLNIAS